MNEKMALKSRKIANLLSLPISAQGRRSAVFVAGCFGEDFNNYYLRCDPPLVPLFPNFLSSPAETLGSQVLPPLSFTACRWPSPGFPAGALALYFPADSGLLPFVRESACIPASRSLSLTRTLPAIAVRVEVTRLHHSLYATACGFGKHPWLGQNRILNEPSLYRVGARSVTLRRDYHTNPPSAYTSERATNVATSFQVAR